MSDRDRDLDASYSVMHQTLESIARRGDCDYADVPEQERPRPCPCSPCTAKDALHLVGNWRYMGARHGRIATMPRERKIVEAWRQDVGDKRLGQILCDRAAENAHEETPWDPPSPRDWYVATSVIQWLATNVGMEVLRKAGFEYKKYDEDRNKRREP